MVRFMDAIVWIHWLLAFLWSLHLKHQYPVLPFTIALCCLNSAFISVISFEPLLKIPMKQARGQVFAVFIYTTTKHAVLPNRKGNTLIIWHENGWNYCRDPKKLTHGSLFLCVSLYSIGGISIVDPSVCYQVQNDQNCTDTKGHDIGIKTKDSGATWCSTFTSNQHAMKKHVSMQQVLWSALWLKPRWVASTHKADIWMQEQLMSSDNFSGTEMKCPAESCPNLGFRYKINIILNSR